jgi:hypothetical protein
MSTTSHSRSARIAADQALLAGVQKFLMSYPSLSVDGQTMTPANIVQFLENRINAAQAAQTAEAARTAALKSESDVRAQTAAEQLSLRQIAQGMFSGTPDNLAVFGLKPRKASSETATTRAAAAVKAKATRKARGTLGPKAKLEITGGSTPETSTPPKA